MNVSRSAKNAQILSWEPLRVIGDISYPLREISNGCNETTSSSTPLPSSSTSQYAPKSARILN